MGTRWRTVREESDMASASRSGKMEQSIKDSGETIKPTAREHSGTQMEITMRVNSDMTNRTALVSTLAQMERSTKVSGLTMSSTKSICTDKVRLTGQMAQVTSVITCKAGATGSVPTSGTIRICTLANGMITQ